MFSTPLALLICIGYAKWHKGTDWIGIVLGTCFGAALGSGPLRSAIESLNDAIGVGLNEAIQFLIQFAGRALGGGDKPVTSTPPVSFGVVAVRYNLNLIGIGR